MYMSVKIKNILLGLIPVVILVLAGLIVSFYSNKLVSISEESRKLYKMLENIADIKTIFKGIENNKNGYLLSGSDDYLEPFNSLGKTLEDKLMQFEKNFTSIGLVSALSNVKNVKEYYKNWIEYSAQPEIDLRKMVSKGEAEWSIVIDAVIGQTGKQITDNLHYELDYIYNLTEKAVTGKINEYHEYKKKSSIITFFSIAAAALLIFASSWLSSSIILKPVLAMTKSFRELAEGEADLTKRIDIKTKDETGKMAGSFNEFLQNMDALIKQIRQAADEVSSGAEQISDSSAALSQGASEQASSLEQISASISEISSRSRQNADNALQASQLAKKAREDAGKGSGEMSSLETAMNQINNSSGEIKKIVKIIDDIAFQINLLALNANVEAARAGKYGKGFAVVAEEVRNLAGRSAESVKETTEKIEQSIRNIENGNILVSSTSRQLNEIVKGTLSVAELVEEIVAASKEQSQGLEQINQGLSQIDTVTQSNTANAEESAGASEELSSMARQLKGMVSRFKLSDSGGQNNNGRKKLKSAESDISGLIPSPDISNKVHAN